ncbi:MAG: lamin tail domain-containing protein [Spirochaetes bacterium]|nr:lamin tail domain-containing protein [Spirochaetota bacterium]
MKIIGGACLSLLFLIVSCDYPGRYRPFLALGEPRVVGIELFLSNSSILERETLQAKAYVILDDGRKKEAPSAVWQTMNEDILSIDQGGVITGLRPGIGTVCAAIDGIQAAGSVEVRRRIDYSRIMISEVFYDAAGADDGKEFIELYNDNDYACDIGGMMVVDGAAASKAFVFPPSSVMGPKSWAVIAQSSEGFAAAFGKSPDYGNFSFSLNNSGETVLLKLPDGAVMDTVFIKGGTEDFMTPESWGSAALPAAQAGQSVFRINFTSSISSAGWSNGSPTPGF